jgi:hypothetical protein
MKKLLAAVVALCFAIPASAAEIYYSPGLDTQIYSMDGNGIISLWGVPEANGQALVANPDYGWPTELAIASWYTTLVKAQELSLRVAVGYDPVTLDIWYITKPRP